MDMGKWLDVVGGMRESLTVKDLAEDYSKNETFLKIIQKINQVIDANEKTEALEEHVEEKKNEAKGEGSLNSPEKKKADAGPIGSGGLDKTITNVYAPLPKHKTVKRVVDSLPGLPGLSHGDTWHIPAKDQRKPDTIFVIH